MMYFSNQPDGHLPMNPPQSSVPLRAPHVYTAVERWLLPVALLAALLFDRLILVRWSGPVGDWLSQNGYALSWLALTAAFCVLNRSKLVRRPVAWLAGGLCVSLALWFPIVGGQDNGNYAVLTTLVLPVALMGFAQFVWGGFTLAQPGRIALAWAAGFLVRPFSAIGKCFGAVASIVRPEGKGRGLRIAIGCGVSLAIVAWLFSMMREADLVFGYYVNIILRDFDLAALCRHGGFVLVFGTLLYSFLWNSRFAVRNELVLPEVRLDRIVCAIVLCAVLAAYALFSVVQFTFLFGRAGLPAGLTYSQYAVSGFWQVVNMAMFNLALFGAVLRFGPEQRVFRGLLAGVVVATGVMLASAAVRLSMYVGAYGMTWLRLISAWFLIYLAAVLVLCTVRLFYKRLPLVSVSALLLLGWYAALGYANPAGIIAWFTR